MTYINRELAANPDELRRVRLKLLDAAGMRLADIHGVSTQGVDDLEVMTEHVGVLVILLGDVLPDRAREGDLRRLAEGDRELVGLRAWEQVSKNGCAACEQQLGTYGAIATVAHVAARLSARSEAAASR